MGFQAVVNQYPAPGIEGDFASDNPRATVPTDPAGGVLVVASPGPLVCGRFGWVVAGAVSNASPGGNVLPDGFVAREQQGVLVVWLQEASLACIQQGYGVDLFNWGDFFVRPGNNVTVGMKVFVNLGTGQVQGAAAGGSIAGYVGTASFATNVMTIVTTSSGTVHVGDVVTAAGVTAGTYVTGQTSPTTFTLSTSPGTIATEAAATSPWFETQWNIKTACSAGEVAKMSRIS